MASVKQLILDDIVNNLEDITIENGYNTDLRLAVKGKVVATDEFSALHREAMVQCKFISQTNDISSQQSGALHLAANAIFRMQAYMHGASHEEFMGFLDDIEAALAKCPDRAVFSDAYKSMNSYITDIDMHNGSEKDEILGEDSGRIREQVAEILLNVAYIYIPELLSGRQE